MRVPFLTPTFGNSIKNWRSGELWQLRYEGRRTIQFVLILKMGKENMKKLYIFIVLASLLLLSACGTAGFVYPFQRLVGHWRSINTVVKGEYYFGEINEETGKGSRSMLKMAL